MRQIVSEYGLVTVSLIGCIWVFAITVVMFNLYKDFSCRFVGTLTGVTMPYDSNVTLEDIDEYGSSKWE